MTEWIGLFKTFGLFVSLAFVLASYVLVAELKRKEKQGVLPPKSMIAKGKGNTGVSFHVHTCRL